MGTGKCRVATEEGKTTCWPNFPWFVLRTPPHPLYAFLAGRMKRLTQQTPAVALPQGSKRFPLFLQPFLQLLRGVDIYVRLAQNPFPVLAGEGVA